MQKTLVGPPWANSFAPPLCTKPATPVLQFFQRQHTPMTNMKALLAQFEAKPPHLVLEWKDTETEAEGWVVINSLRGGAAGGGTRMRKGLDKREVESLAKTMEVKFTVCGPPIGGAKSGINFDPADPRKHGVLQRWFKAVYPLLKSYYGTGGDLNVDGYEEVIPITEAYGLWHPQEGIVTGHLRPNKAQKIQAIGQLRAGVSKVVEDPRYSPDTARRYNVTDMITGWGVAESVRHYYNLWGGDLAGKRVIVQGWGNVAAAAGLYLAKAGARIVAIIDKAGGVLNANGYSYEQVKQLFLDRKGNALQSPDMIPAAEVQAKVWSMGAEVFIPAAASRLVTKEQLEHLMAAGLEVISCGANVPFADPEIFLGPVGEFADSKVSLIPDFVANCGMARVFAYLMQPNASITDEAIFTDTSEVIRKALEEVHAQHADCTHLAAACFERSLAVLV